LLDGLLPGHSVEVFGPNQGGVACGLEEP
jgi:hypothetical protein